MLEKLRAILQFLRDPSTSRFYMPPKSKDADGLVTYFRADPESLEKLLVAIVQIRTHKGLVVNLRPQDVLQPWVLRQIPEPMEMHACSFNHVRGYRGDEG